MSDRKPTTGPLRHTDELTEDRRLTSSRCPVCGIDRPTFRDKSFTLFFARHQQSGRSTWCKMSGQKVTK
jgi:hypothetical protein